MKAMLSGIRSAVVWAFAAILVFGVCAVGGVAVASRDRIVPGVIVLGQPVGGLTVQNATARLAPTSVSILDQSLLLQAGERSWTTTPRALGMKLDPAELAASAFSVGHGGSLAGDLRQELAAMRSETVIPISSTGDGSALADLMQRIAADINTAPQTAQLALADDGTLNYQPSQTGLELDQVQSRGLVTEALAEGRPNVMLVTHTLPPQIETQQVAAAHDKLVRILADPAPIQLTAGQQHWSVQHAQLPEMLSLTLPDGRDGTASVEVRDEPLQTLMQGLAGQIDQDALDARFSWTDDQLALLRPGHDGQALNQAAAVDVLKTGILAGQRSLELPVEVVHPAVAAQDGPGLGIRELIGESTTSFAGSIPEKAHNIQLAAQRLNGVVVPPGGTFSFNKEVGPTTLEAGFQWGFGLTTGSQGGVHTVPSVAGGICQVATTLFQPVFWSGYQLEERWWHLYWIPAYASRGVVGLDATVDADSGLDLKWINPTDKPVLIQASTDAEHITFRLFGQKPAWNVQVDDPAISNRVVADPTPEVQEEPSLPWGRTLLVESARDGFTVLLTRHVTPTGSGQPRELALKSVYAPAHTVTLVGTGGAPDQQSVASALERVRASQQALVAMPAPGSSSGSASGGNAGSGSGAGGSAGGGAGASGSASPASSAPTTHATPNGPRTLGQIRDELRQAGWGGGSDQDALETYQRLAGAAPH